MFYEGLSDKVGRSDVVMFEIVDGRAVRIQMGGDVFERVPN